MSAPIGGPAMTTYQVTSRAHVVGRVALPVWIDTARAAEGGPQQQVYYVSDAELASGEFVLSGENPIPITAVGAVGAEWPPIPVHVVNPTITAQTYSQKILALNPIAYWPLNEPVGTSGAGSVLDASGNSRNGTPDNVTFGVAGIGDGLTATSFPGAVANIDIYSASLAGGFNGGEFAIAGWLKVGAGVWTDGQYRAFCHLRVDANNSLLLDKSGFGTGNMRIIYTAGGVTQSVNPIPIGSPAGYFHVAVVVSKIANSVKFYLNGVDQALGLTGLGIWAGSLTAGNAVIGAQDLGGTSVWSGSIAHVPILPVLTAGQILDIASP